MKIIEPYAEIIYRDGIGGNIYTIEKAGRTCYKSEDKIAPGSAEKFVRGLVSRHHEAMLEHGDYIFNMWYKTADNFLRTLERMRYEGDKPVMLIHTGDAHKGEPLVVSGNIRAWRDFMKRSPEYAAFLKPYINPVFMEDIECADPATLDKDNGFNADDLMLLKYSDLKPEEKLDHERMTVCFRVDRGVTHELTRHRLFSYAMESTRYCNYSKGKYGKEITVIKPCYLTEGTPAYNAWKDACEFAEYSYIIMTANGCTAQEARAVLPHSVKADLWVTGTLAEWKRFFDLRALEKTGKVHPQMAEVAKPLYSLAQKLYPMIFTDELKGEE